MEKLKLDNKSLRKFGITMGITFMAIAFFIFLRHKYHLFAIFTTLAAVFFILAFIVPNLLKPINIVWMGLAYILGWINTRLILIFIFYLVFTAIGLIMRLFGRDLIDKKIEKGRDSYWKKKETAAFNRLGYEKQF